MKCVLSDERGNMCVAESVGMVCIARKEALTLFLHELALIARAILITEGKKKHLLVSCSVCFPLHSRYQLHVPFLIVGSILRERVTS